MSTESNRVEPGAGRGTARSGLIERLDQAAQTLQGWAIFGLLILLVGMTFYQVVLRNLPGNPSVPWIDLASRLVVLWVGLLGASLAVARDKHISIDIATRIMPARFVPWVRGATGALTLLVMTILVHASVAFTLAKYEASSLPLFVIEALKLEVFEWVFTDVVPVIFLLMLWHAWVAWRRDIGSHRVVRIAALVVGGLLVVLVIGILGVDFGWFGLEGVRTGLDASVGALVKGAPTLFILLTVVLAVLGAPLYIVIAGIALVGHYAIEAIPVQNFIADGIGGFRKSTIFLAIPLFTLAGYLMAEGKTPQRLVGLFRGFLGWLPGGVAIVALIACSFFTAFTGASGVTIIALGGLLLPILMEDRYPEKFTLGLLTTGGSRGLIFPPAIPVFLLAMIMGLSWDAVTATGPFGSAVMTRAERQALVQQEIVERREQLALNEELSAGDDAMEEELDRLLQQKLADEGLAEEPAPAGDDEFELGEDDAFGAADDGGGDGDEFELGEDEAIGSPDEGEAEGDEFELGEDEAIAAPAADGDEFELGEDEAIAAPAAASDEFELGDDEGLSDDEGGDPAGAAESSREVAAAAEEQSAESAAAAAVDLTDSGIVVPSSTQIFTAGLIPGLLMVLAIALYSIFIGFRRKVVRVPFSPRGAGRALIGARWEMVIPVLIGVGIFGGFLTPAEAASATAAYTMLMQLVLYRDFGIRQLVRIFVDSMVLVGGILIILMAAMGLLNFLVVAQVPDLVLRLIENMVPEELPVLGLFAIPRQITFLLMLNLFLLVVGCMMDIFSAIMVVLPLLLPIAYRFGIHPAHLAVIFLTNLEIGYSTPPVGINLFVASLRFDKPVVRLYAASLAFLAIMFVGLLVITYWPGLSLWLVEFTGTQ